MKLGTITRNHVIGLIMFLECGIIFCFVYFYALPKQKEIAQLNTVLVEKQRKVREIENTKQLLAETSIEIVKLKREISRLEKFTREDVYIPRTLMLLEKLADGTRLAIARFSPSSASPTGRRPGAAGAPGGDAAGNKTSQQPAAAQTATPSPNAQGGTDQKNKKVFNKNDEFREIKIDLDLVGDFRSMYRFLGELASFPKLVVVERIEITRNSSTQKTSGQQPAAPAAMDNRLMIKMPLTFHVQKKASLVTEKGDKKNEEGEKPVVEAQ